MSEFTDALARLPQYNDAPYNASTNPYGMDNQGYLINIPQMTDDIAIVCGGVASAAETVGEMSDDIEALGAISAQISTLAGQIPTLTTVAGLASAITTLSGISAAISTVATNAAAVAAVSSNIGNVNAVNAALTNINAVAAGLTNIATVLTHIANINTTAGSIGNVNLVGGSIGNVNAVAAGLSNIAIAVGALANINLLAPRAADMALLADIQDGTIATGALTTVAANSTAVVNVAAAVAAVNTVAGGMGDVQTVAQNATAVATVAANNAALTTVSANIDAVTSVNDNLAAIQAAPAAASAAASQAAALSGTSTSSVAVGIGSKSFTTQSGKQWAVGSWVLITDSADPANRWLHGQITTYTGTSLTVNVGAVNGSGTGTAWDIRISGPQGAPAAGTGDFVSPATSVAGNLVSFGNTTGKLGEDSGIAKADVFLKSTDTAEVITEGATKKFMTVAERTKLSGIASGADVTGTANVGTALQGASAKTTPVDADTLTGLNSASSNAPMRITWANIKATLKSYFDTLYAAASHSHAWSAITGKPTTLGGFGITDAAPSSHIGSGGTAHADATTSTSGFMSGADKTKLNGMASGATANATDAQLRDRSTHTGTQAASTITGLATVATSGAYSDLSGAPGLATVATSGAYSDLSGRPTLGNVAAMNEATAAQLRSRAADAPISPDIVSEAKNAVSLAYSATRSLVWTDGWFRTCTLTGNMTISNPTSIDVGDTIMLLLVASSTTERTVSWGTYYKGNLPTETVTSTRRLLISLTATSSTEIVVSYVVIE